MADYQADLESAEDAEANPREAIYGLSVEAFEVVTLDEALSRSTRPNRQFRHARAGALRTAGLALTPTMGGSHHTLGVPKPLTLEGWRRLERMFDGPTVNPYHLKRS